MEGGKGKRKGKAGGKGKGGRESEELCAVLIIPQEKP